MFGREHRAPIKREGAAVPATRNMCLLACSFAMLLGVWPEAQDKLTFSAADVQT